MSRDFPGVQEKKKNQNQPSMLLYSCLCKISETLRGGSFLETVGKWLLTFQPFLNLASRFGLRDIMEENSSLRALEELSGPERKEECRLSFSFLVALPGPRYFPIFLTCSQSSPTFLFWVLTPCSFSALTNQQELWVLSSQNLQELLSHPQHTQNKARSLRYYRNKWKSLLRKAILWSQ